MNAASTCLYRDESPDEPESVISLATSMSVFSVCLAVAAAADAPTGARLRSPANGSHSLVVAEAPVAECPERRQGRCHLRCDGRHQAEASIETSSPGWLSGRRLRLEPASLFPTPRLRFARHRASAPLACQ